MKPLPFLIFAQQVLQVTGIGEATALQGITSLTSLCDFPRSTVYVKDAVTLFADTSMPFKTVNLSSSELLAATGVSCKTTVDSSEEDVAGFLVNVKNNLPTHRDHCTSWSKLFRLRSAKQFLSFGCSHHSTQFFARPLRLSFLPIPLRQLVTAYHDRQRERVEDAFTVTITTVAYDCTRDRKLINKWSPCQQVDICIPSHLFCDGVDNCGLGEDERNCAINMIATTTTAATTGATTSAENSIATFTDKETVAESKVATMILANPTSSASIAMVMSFFVLNGFCIVFFLSLGLCSVGCCCSSRLYRAQNEKSRRTFVGYFRKFGSFGNAKTDSAPSQSGEAAPLRKTSATWSISAEQDAGGIVQPHSSPPPPAYTGRTFKTHTLFGLNLRNERHMKECEPEVEDDGGDDGSNLRFLSSMLRQHHSRTNNMLASTFFPMPITALQSPPVASKPINNRPLLPSLTRLKGNRRKGNTDNYFPLKGHSAKGTHADCSV